MQNATQRHTEAVRASFERTADRYDAARRHLIPCFDDFYGTAVALADPRAANARILDLGAGTGLYSAMLRAAYPDAHLTLLDSADDMLGRARERFRHDHRVEFVGADYRDYAPGATFDVVVSALSIHHLPHQDKRELFARVHGWLAPGGRFVNADQARGDGDDMEAYYDRNWLSRVEATGLQRSEITASLERRKLDINAPLMDQLGWLREAGFARVDCVYRNHAFAVFWGWKA